MVQETSGASRAHAGGRSQERRVSFLSPEVKFIASWYKNPARRAAPFLSFLSELFIRPLST